MNEHERQLDERLDANLRVALPMLERGGGVAGVGGEEPSRERIERWKQPAAHTPRQTLGRIGGFIMARKGWLAAAATVAVVGAMWPLSARSSVQASTIVTALKETKFSGVRCTLSKIETEKVFLDGELRVRFNTPITMSQIIGDGHGEGHGEGHGDGHGQGHGEGHGEGHGDGHGQGHGEGHDQAPGADGGGRVKVESAYAKLKTQMRGMEGLGELSLELEGASSPASTWVFGRADKDMVTRLREHLPPIAMMVENGVVVDFGKLDLSEVLGGEEAADLHADLHNLHREIVDEMHGPKNDETGRKAEAVIRGMLLGTATAENLKELNDMLTSASVNSKVENMGGGRHLLTATKFGAAAEKAGAKEAGDDHAAGDDAAAKGKHAGRKVRHGGDEKHIVLDKDGRELLDNATLRAMYVEDAGVEWIEIADLGAAHGSLRVEFTNDVIEPSTLEMSRVVKPGKTSVISFDMIKGLLGGD